MTNLFWKIGNTVYPLVSMKVIKQRVLYIKIEVITKKGILKTLSAKQIKFISDKIISRSLYWFHTNMCSTYL